MIPFGSRILFLALILLASCKPTKRTASPDDYFPLILVGIEAGKSASLITRNEAIQEGNFGGCVAAEIWAEALDASLETLSGRLEGYMVLPAIRLDLGECMEIADKNPRSEEEVAVFVGSIAGAALSVSEFYAAKLEPTNCKKALSARGVLSYLRALIPEIVRELESPDGVFEADPVRWDLSC